MGERKGQNKYYPPDFDPKKHRSLDAYHGTHALRERARKLDKGILIIRFEMPYNIWCEGCKNPVGMGVRYNAEKSKIGMYYTTPIYKFRMKCHLCNNHYEIKTDPANHDYVIISGARRKEQRWDPKDNEQIVTEDKEDQKKMATDAMYKLEHGADDKAKSKATMPAISQLTEIRDPWKDDYTLNQILRKQFRDVKKAKKVEAEKDQALLQKSSLDIDLVPENDEDMRMAELLKYSAVKSFDEKTSEKRNDIDNQSIFLPHQTSATSPDSSSSSESAKSVQTSLDAKHDQARKVLGNVVSRGKNNPFGINNVSSSQKRQLSSQNLGIVRKKKTINNESLTVNSATEVQEPVAASTASQASSNFGIVCEKKIISTDNSATDIQQPIVSETLPTTGVDPANCSSSSALGCLASMYDTESNSGTCTDSDND